MGLISYPLNQRFFAFVQFAKYQNHKPNGGKMKTLSKSILLSLIAVLFITAYLTAQPNRGEGREIIKEKFKLTDAQETQIENLRIEHQKKMIDLRAKLQKAQIEVKELLNSENFKRSDFLAVHDKLNQIRNEIHTATANHQMDVYDLLDKEQRKVFVETMDKMKHKMNRSFHGNRMKDKFDNPRFEGRRFDRQLDQD